MRIIAGHSRGRRIYAPEGLDVRPTSDRTKEAMFNSLGSRGLIVDATVLDLFSGSGALGLEAWSRGAAKVTCVESDNKALTMLRENIDVLGAGEEVSAIRGDVMGWLATTPRPCDLVLADPPYEFDQWSELLQLLDAPAALLESDREIEAPPGWEIDFARRYGRAWVTLLVRPQVNP